MVAVAYKNRTREEIIAAFRESIRKKQEWIKQSDEEFKKIREERRQLALWIRSTLLWQSGAYQFYINNESHQPSPNDEKLKATVFRIVEAFFTANPDILLYICETGDGRQAFRSRLFIRWFNIYSGRDAYVMQTAEVQEGKTKNFAALIVQKSNPRLEEILAEFNETISILTNKPE